jgi:RNA polymerase sigma-70 factor (sigma-E family)
MRGQRLPFRPQDGGGRVVGEPDEGVARPNKVTETLVASTGLPNAYRASATVPNLAWSADRAVTELYAVHYRGLVRLASFLVRDTPTAEEVVQDAFIAMADGWQRLRDAEKALAYLRQAVVNRSRSVLRHRTVVDKNMQKAPPDMPSAEHGALVLLERSAVVSALRELPERQREAIVLRYYADLSEAEIAATMRISRGAVKSHTARGMAALRVALEQE